MRNDTMMTLFDRLSALSHAIFWETESETEVKNFNSKLKYGKKTNGQQIRNVPYP